MKTKNSFYSKINWVGFSIAMFGLMSDPEFSGYMSTFVSQEAVSRVMAISGVIVMILRTFFTTQGLHLPGKGSTNS